jgi:hypothetical protein
MDVIFFGAIPAVHYIYRAEPRHNRMPFPSGLKLKFGPHWVVNWPFCLNKIQIL